MSTSAQTHPENIVITGSVATSLNLARDIFLAKTSAFEGAFVFESEDHSFASKDAFYAIE